VVEVEQEAARRQQIEDMNQKRSEEREGFYKM
jgi:hypothetical protein